MAASVLQYLPRFLPEIKISPLPEQIFLSTIKALLVPAMNLSPSQWGAVGTLILLTNFSPTLRKATVQLYGYLSLIIGVEIAFINSYVLLCSWISPSTTLQPLTVVVLNLMNSVIPVFTDSVILFHLVKEKASQSNSRIELIRTMGTPVILKFARLVSAVLFIRASADFVYASLSTTKYGIAPDFAAVEAARTRGVYMSSGLQLFDNVFSLGVYWTYVNKLRELSASTASLSPKSLSDLIWTFGSHYILPIILNGAQLATTSLMPSSNAATLIDSAKVVLNIAGASVAALRKQLPQAVLAVHAPSEKNEDLSRVATEVPAPPAPPPDVDDVTTLAQDLVSEETVDQTDSETNEPRS
ncbi:hypothetical protein EDB86DRAFT_3073366 [Lactarius hatsudake]|nr:hypothetical protein EDB86DRAFT_3073366 [Lactarius hatsudake]